MAEVASFECCQTSHREGLGALLRDCHDFCISHALSPRALSQVFVLCDEVIANIARHGYGGGTGHITVRMRLRTRGLSWGLTIAFIDEAPPFDPLNHRATGAGNAHGTEGGFGLSLMKSFADRVRYSRRHGCNVLVLWKRVKQQKCKRDRKN